MSDFFAAVIAFRLFFHPFEARVVVRELVEMRKRNLPGDYWVVAGHVRGLVVKAVLELHVHSHSKLLDVEGGSGPVDPDLLADLFSRVGAEALPGTDVTHEFDAPSSKLTTDTPRELVVRALGLHQITCLVEAFACLEQIRRQTGQANVDAETLDQATSLDDGPAGLPEGTSFVRARLGLAPGREAEHAVLGFGLVHSSSVEPGRTRGIRRHTDSVAAFY